MPNVFVVGDQQDFAALTAAVLRPRVSASTRASAAAAIRRANPGLDLDRLTPGTVVVVPDVEGARHEPKSDPVRGAVTDLVERLQEGLRGLEAGEDAGEAQRVADKKEAQDLFGSALVKRLAAAEPQLAENIESVRATFKEDDSVAKRQRAELRKSVVEWEEDLAKLVALL